jgi:hypothetical protein
MMKVLSQTLPTRYKASEQGMEIGKTRRRTPHSLSKIPITSTLALTMILVPYSVLVVSLAPKDPLRLNVVPQVIKTKVGNVLPVASRTAPIMISSAKITA